MNTPRFVVALPAVALLFLSGCHHDCCDDASDVSVASASASAPTHASPPTTPPAMEPPEVTGTWTGRWDSRGHPGHGGGLKCEAKLVAPGKWEAVFTAEYGPTKSYNVKLDGTAAYGTVLFGGDVDLGKEDGGVFKWSGRATATEFIGKYEGGGDAGSFKLTRNKA